MSSNNSSLTPKQWPKQVVDSYEPVRKLGKGGFGLVVLAKRKGSTKTDANQLVAIKVVGSEAASSAEIGYAHREIDILKELNHPNIVRLVDFWELPVADQEHQGCAAVIALEYVKGPTLDSLLREGGALSLVFARIVAAQLCDAVAFLHSHGVIHRDLKPDNIIVSGASSSQHDVWNDVVGQNEEDVDWAELRGKWRVKLIDFGFARAFGPDELKAVMTRTGSTLGSSHGRSSIDDSSQLKPDRSISRKFHRKMSALGNRSYAAPEIIGTVVERNLDTSDATLTISQYVSDYGMLADAYSLGLVIRYMVTGISPVQNFEAAVAWEKHPLNKTGRWLRKRLLKKKQRKRKVRLYEDSPTEVVRLIMGMAQQSSKKRTTVRAARRFPWIADVLDDWEDTKHIKCLEFTKNRTMGFPVQVCE